jgi:hypothetical protein
MKVYLSLEVYKELKESREHEASMLDLIRTKKSVKQPDQPAVSKGLQKLKKKIHIL